MTRAADNSHVVLSQWSKNEDGSYSHPNGARVFQDEQSPRMGLYDHNDPMRRGWSYIDPTLVGDDKRCDPHRQYQGPYPEALDLVAAMTCECGAFKTEFYAICDDCWLPEWVKDGAVFALPSALDARSPRAGQTFRIISIGSSNRFTYPNISPHIYAEPIAMSEDERFHLPDAPASIADVAQSLRQLFRDTPQFTRDDMLQALHLAPPIPKDTP